MFALHPNNTLCEENKKTLISPIYFSFVNWDFKHRDQLIGWKNTETVVFSTLKKWDAGLKVGAREENKSPEDFGKFLAAIPPTTIGEVQVVYLASHQAENGIWDFTQNELADWNYWKDSAPPVGEGFRFVILDTCHAGTLASHPVFKKFSSATLFAAKRGELSREMYLTRKQPVDWSRRFPTSTAWAKNLLGERGDALSYLGVFWLEASFQNPPPRTKEDWLALAQKISDLSAATAPTLPKRVSSTISVQ